jgi:hypothetical protein
MYTARSIVLLFSIVTMFGSDPFRSISRRSLTRENHVHHLRTRSVCRHEFTIQSAIKNSMHCFESAQA